MDEKRRRRRPEDNEERKRRKRNSGERANDRVRKRANEDRRKKSQREEINEDLGLEEETDNGNKKLKIIIIGAILGIILLVVFIYGLSQNSKQEDIDNIIKVSEKENNKEKETTKKEGIKEVGYYVPTKDEYTSDYVESIEDEREKLFLKVLERNNLLNDGQDNQIMKRFKTNAQRNVLRYVDVISSKDEPKGDEIVKELNELKYNLTYPTQIFNEDGAYYILSDYSTTDLGYRKIDEGIYIGYPSVNLDESGDDLDTVNMQLLLVDDIEESKLEKLLNSKSPKLDSIVLKDLSYLKDNAYMKLYKDVLGDVYTCTEKDKSLDISCYPDFDIDDFIDEFGYVDEEGRNVFDGFNLMYRGIGFSQEDVDKLVKGVEKLNSTEDDYIKKGYKLTKYGGSIEYPFNYSKTISGGNIYNLTYVIPEIDKGKQELKLTIGGETFTIYKELPVESGLEKEFVNW